MYHPLDVSRLRCGGQMNGVPDLWGKEEHFTFFVLFKDSSVPVLFFFKFNVTQNMMTCM